VTAAGSTPGGLFRSPCVFSLFHPFCTLKLSSLQEGFYSWEQVVISHERSEEEEGYGGNDTITPHTGVSCRSLIKEHDTVGVI
jgi:hypothetical protein